MSGVERSFTVTSGVLAAGDMLTGALTRAPGESLGAYAIGQGSLAAGPNYVLTFHEGRLTIGPPAWTDQPVAAVPVRAPAPVQPEGRGPLSLDPALFCQREESCPE